MIDEAFEQVRDLSVDLRPLLLDDFGLVTSLRSYVDGHAQRTGVSTSFRTRLLDAGDRFSRELEITCFRIVQEALTNVARHARAKQVSVRLSQKGHTLRAHIRDDGVGFDVGDLQERGAATLGLRGMQERAQALGGRIKIVSARSKGTQVSVSLPIEKPKTQEDGREKT